MLDHYFNPTWDKSNSKRFEENGMYGKTVLGWFLLSFGWGVFPSLEKVAFLLRESMLLLTFFFLFWLTMCHYECKKVTLTVLPPPVSMYVYYMIYRGKVLKTLEAIFSTEIGQNLTELSTETFKIHKDTEMFGDFFPVKFLRRGNSFAH